MAVFEKLYSQKGFGFIYESLESVGERGRYSFIGARPLILFKSKQMDIEIDYAGKVQRKKANPMDSLRNIVAGVKEFPSLEPFCGGAVGYIAYDAVRFFEDIPDKNPDELRIPDTYFMFPSEIIIFDHKKQAIDIVVYNGDSKRTEELISEIEKSEEICFKPSEKQIKQFSSNFTKDSFCKVVKTAKEHIFAGDIFQVVLSQRFAFPIDTEPINIYKALRITNPSPYMYYLKLNNLFILGSSPETLIKLVAGTAISRPLAGTKPRGETEEQDRRLESELLNDEKELAEHIMLVDLARNDLGRVCEYGSVRVTELLNTERYSKVMHIVSNVIGELNKDQDAFDLLGATFPAGTVSGAPKVRAMEIIDELEPTKRGIYAGAIGYFGFGSNMDLCIAIRTIVIKNRIAYIQGGAGIVADSIPEREYIETLNKIKALNKAVEIAS
ncbi:MAG: anthranilate synthase component I [bacterium]